MIRYAKGLTIGISKPWGFIYMIRYDKDIWGAMGVRFYLGYILLYFGIFFAVLVSL